MFENAKKPDSKLAGVSPQECRVHPRYPFSAAAEAVYAETRLLGRTSDLSKGGCYVDTINPCPMGADVRIRISKGNLAFVAQGKMMYAAVGMGMPDVYEHPPAGAAGIAERVEWRVAARGSGNARAGSPRRKHGQ
jgi:hypothetical protein